MKNYQLLPITTNYYQLLPITTNYYQLLLIGFLVFFLNSCSDETEGRKQESPINNEHEIVSKANDGARITTSGQYITTDWSGQVQVLTVFVDYETLEHIAGFVQLPADYVLIGGGCNTYNVTAGALLTSNFPDGINNRWWASSKSHIDSDPHGLRIYATGLKIQGVSAATLKANMVYPISISPTPGISTPSWNVLIPSPNKLIGGGAQVLGNQILNALIDVFPISPLPNNMLVESFPSGQGWFVKSKDHLVAEPRRILAYAIGINENIPGFGFIDVTTTSTQISVVSGTKTLNVSLPPNSANNYVNVGVGAKDSYTSGGWGRMLTAMAPAGNPSDAFPFTPYVQSKDHKRACGGTLYAYGLFVRKRP